MWEVGRFWEPKRWGVGPLLKRRPGKARQAKGREAKAKDSQASLAHSHSILLSSRLPSSATLPPPTPSHPSKPACLCNNSTPLIPVLPACLFLHGIHFILQPMCIPVLGFHKREHPIYEVP